MVFQTPHHAHAYAKEGGGVRQFTMPSLHAVGPRYAHWIGRPHNRGDRSHTRPMRSYGFLWVEVLWCSRPPFL